MKTSKFILKNEVCEILGVSVHTFDKWYNWQYKLLKEGKIEKPYLPKPTPLLDQRGKPNGWTNKQIKELVEYQKSIIHGRNGTYGMYSNPMHRETKKYKKQTEEENAK